MKTPPTAEADLKLWSVVTATVRPLACRTHGRRAQSVHAPLSVAPAGPPAAPVCNRAPPGADPPVPKVAISATPVAAPAASVASAAKIKPRPRRAPAPAALEPGRRRRIERGREAPAAVIDLHGLIQDEARAALTQFVRRSFAEGRRTLLVITGKGALGDGVLRRRVPEWLGQPPLRPMIAGLSEAHRRHGGEGALYVALRRS